MFTNSYIPKLQEAKDVISKFSILHIFWYKDMTKKEYDAKIFNNYVRLGCMLFSKES